MRFETFRAVYPFVVGGMEKNRGTRCEALTLQKTPNQLSLLGDLAREAALLSIYCYYKPHCIAGLHSIINRLGVELTTTSVTHILWKGSRVNKAKISDRSSMKTNLSC